LALTISSPPAATEAPAPEAWAPEQLEPVPASSEESTIEFEKSTVKKARYGLGITDVQVDRGPEKYRLHVRTWNEIVREDPDLRRYQGQGRMFSGGIVLTSIGGTWLALSTALMLDGHYARTSVGGFFQWFVPGTLATTGLIMTIVSVRARHKLRAAHRRFFPAPYASADQAGVAVTGRF
jgi:hypothetical protein